jgi:NADH-quinone oxidoreductase subunit G
VVRYDYGKETRTLLDLPKNQPDLIKQIKKAKNLLIFYGSEGMDLKASRAFSQACANILIEYKKAGKTNNGLIPVWPEANMQGAWEMGFKPLDDLQSSLEKAKTILIAGTDPIGQGVISEFNKQFVIVHELFLTETAQAADLVLPAAAPTEKSGSVTSGDRRLQLFETALTPKRECLADYQISARIAERLNIDSIQDDASDILKRIIKEIPGYGSVTLEELRAAPEQWPFVAKEALSFTGTVFKNTYGVGMQLTPSREVSKLKTKKLSQPRPKFSKGPIAVPISRLYDQGMMISTSKVLEPRLDADQLIVNPDDAASMELTNNVQVEIILNGQTYQGNVLIDKAAPEGVILIPRNYGIQLDRPVNVEVKGLK